jgi:hypothetical protein
MTRLAIIATIALVGVANAFTGKFSLYRRDRCKRGLETPYARGPISNGPCCVVVAVEHP